MKHEEFRQFAHKIVDWMADYLKNVENYPVKSQAKPGEIFKKLPDHAPEKGESMDLVLKDFHNIILPGITHWQSPNFFAYFPANSSFSSLLAEMITATLGTQCMKWVTSPAAAELEEKVMNWLIDMIGLPDSFEGVIQDSASSATLCALLSAREKYSGYKINENGAEAFRGFKVYCSTETHSSIEKAVKIAGLGKKNLVKIDVDDAFCLRADLLQQAIKEDIEQGNKPICVVATLGTTGSTAVDPLPEIAEICCQHDIWLHIDAAYAGSALILEEYRWMIKGIDKADSFVFNPHKWLFTNFDCSAYFVKDSKALLRTLAILPEYLKTKTEGEVKDYCDWGVPLGRRFRALKLWFVIRDFGVKGLKERLRFHLHLAREFARWVEEEEDFQLTAPVTFNLVCFRLKPKGEKTHEEINRINERLLNELNNTGELYLTHTKLKGMYTLRMVIAQTNVKNHHVEKAWSIIKEKSKKFLV
jgi:aromatic-L-amino-acid decarboxylase